jgi:hypothetical protein
MPLVVALRDDVAHPVQYADEAGPPQDVPPALGPGDSGATAPGAGDAPGAPAGAARGAEAEVAVGALALFLVRRAVRSVRVAMALFWHLTVERSSGGGLPRRPARPRPRRATPHQPHCSPELCSQLQPAAARQGRTRRCTAACWRCSARGSSARGSPSRRPRRCTLWPRAAPSRCDPPTPPRGMGACCFVYRLCLSET